MPARLGKLIMAFVYDAIDMECDEHSRRQSENRNPLPKYIYINF